MVKSLSDLPVGETAVISSIEGTTTVKRRFMDMGFVKGTTVRVEKVAPLGDPIQISLKGYNICVRKADAQNILLN